jgi:hypothetical protein
VHDEACRDPLTPLGGSQIRCPRRRCLIDAASFTRSSEISLTLRKLRSRSSFLVARRQLPEDDGRLGANPVIPDPRCHSSCHAHSGNLSLEFDSPVLMAFRELLSRMPIFVSLYSDDLASGPTASPLIPNSPPTATANSSRTTGSIGCR